MKRYGVAESPVGPLLLAESESGLCWLSFVNKSEVVSETLHREFPGQGGSQDDAWAKAIVNKWFIDKSLTINLAPQGTSFQSSVWNALLNIPLGTTVSYSALANTCGHPSAIRAVASAVGRNPISIFIPCHRVLPKDGSIGNYRWGADGKKALLEWEASLCDQPGTKN